MKQYLQLLKDIKEKGCYKPPARKNMPGTQSLFGYQFRHNLQDGFPLLTTKKMYWKGVVIELLWFLRGDTNIKFLVDNGVNFWNEDAYNYYLKQFKMYNQGFNKHYSFEEFIEILKSGISSKYFFESERTNYQLGDCGYQYGKVWRDWNGINNDNPIGILKVPAYSSQEQIEKIKNAWKNAQGKVAIVPDDINYQSIQQINIKIDQIKNVINSLKNNPQSRRHIVTAIDPAHDNDLALYWCHCLFQFNCRPLTLHERSQILEKDRLTWDESEWRHEFFDSQNISKYYLDCQLYQRSCDVFLGVPYNIASYVLLTHIIAEICNMIPGEYVHTFGDVHIYDNHKDAVEEQLKRTPSELPKLKIMFKELDQLSFDAIDNIFNKANETDFQLINYNPQSSIKAELSTGMVK